MTQFFDILLLLFPFIAVLMVGARVIAWCRAQGMVVEINGRHAHSKPTPHGGGLVLPLFGAPLGIWMVWDFQLPYGGFLMALMLASLLVAGVGLYDDKYGLSAKTRLVVHLLAVAIGIAYLPPMFDFMPIWLDKLILLLAWGWFVNLYNFMDGADGLAASEGAFLLIALTLLVPVYKPLALPLAGLCLGFLAFNWQPARMFLGDVGSTWLGYVLGGLLLVACADDTLRMIWPLLTITLVFTADATWTLVRRLCNGHKPWVPHREFWFHRVLALDYTHSQLGKRVAGINLLLLVLAGLGIALDAEPLMFVLGVALMLALAFKIRKMEKTIGK